MDKDEHERTLSMQTNAHWFRYGYKSRLGLTKATASWGTEDHPSPWFYKYIDDVRMNVVQNGKLARCFWQSDGDEPKRKLTPMFYYHGLACMRTAQSVTCRDMASHGLLVMSIDHFDGTANYSRKQRVPQEPNLYDEKYWSSMHDWQDRQIRIDQMETRKEECKSLIDALFEDKFPQTELGFEEGVELELDKLIVGGHSFGGMTAIAMSECDERVKATVTLDPWLWVIIEKIDNREYKVNTA